MPYSAGLERLVAVIIKQGRAATAFMGMIVQITMFHATGEKRSLLAVDWIPNQRSKGEAISVCSGGSTSRTATVTRCAPQDLHQEVTNARTHNQNRAQTPNTGLYIRHFFFMPIAFSRVRNDLWHPLKRDLINLLYDFCTQTSAIGAHCSPHIAPLFAPVHFPVLELLHRLITTNTLLISSLILIARCPFATDFPP